MKVKIFNYDDEIDLEEDINDFISDNDIEIIDIKYQVSTCDEVICFSGMIIYTENNMV